MQTRKYTVDEQHILDLAVAFNKFRHSNINFDRRDQIMAMLQDPALAPVKHMANDILYNRSGSSPKLDALEIEVPFRKFVVQQALECGVDLDPDALNISKDELNVALA